VMCALDSTPDVQGAQQTANQAQTSANDGRPRQRMVTCTAVRNGHEFNIARRMVEEGYAVARGATFEREAQDAVARARGLTTWCTLRPDVWRQRSNAERNAFRDRGTYLREWATFGTCPPPVRPRSAPRDTPAVSAPE
ncbi:MAG: hypothetical protein AB7O04_01540, partial [Hyphomonadaceae bacterium]